MTMVSVDTVTTGCYLGSNKERYQWLNCFNVVDPRLGDVRRVMTPSLELAADKGILTALPTRREHHLLFKLGCAHTCVFSVPLTL